MKCSSVVVVVVVLVRIPFELTTLFYHFSRTALLLTETTEVLLASKT